MFLVDSNIIIYSYKSEYDYLPEMLFKGLVYVSEISRIEVLGYHKLTAKEEYFYMKFFEVVPIIYPTREIFNKTLEIRRAYNLALGDSLIASTALVNDLTLYTRNVADFKRVDGLELIDPIL